MTSTTDGTPKSPSSSERRRPLPSTALAAGDTSSRCCALLLLAVILLSSLGEVGAGDQGGSRSPSSDGSLHRLLAGGRFLTGAAGKPCDEIYIVGEGETLHTISDKCHDPFIIERNPHIYDPDDVFPGLVIKIVPLAPGR